ncbi:hypothetical protein LCGC14_1945890, partial [marine sediment metagenome]
MGKAEGSVKILLDIDEVLTAGEYGELAGVAEAPQSDEEGPDD